MDETKTHHENDSERARTGAGAPRVGERVGAMLSARDGHIVLLGYGERLEDAVPDEAVVGPVGAFYRKLGATNPRLQLDNGDVVYGLECWWGHEAAVKQRVASCARVEEARIADARARVRALDKSSTKSDQ